jgi:ATP-binding cassette subfamily B protein
MVIQDPLMSAIAILAAPAAFAGMARLSRTIRKLAKGEIASEGALVSVGVEALDGIRTVKAFHLEDRIEAAFSAAIERKEIRALKLQRVAAAAGASMEIFGGMIVVAFLLYASWRTAAHGTTPGQFTSFLAAFLLAYEPAKKIAGANLQLQRKLAAVSKLAGELDSRETAMPSLPGANAIRGAVEFDRVRFVYRGRRPALDGVSFSVAPGERIGIAGRSGSGKSTLVDLIMAMLRADSGRVTIDGHDIAGFDPASVRACISLVTQEIFIFAGTIADNIADGRTGASRAEVEEAARLAGVGAFTAALPSGLDTALGDKGAGLSGGEKQRVAIARALLKKAPILIYDEATSALDGETERMILRNAFPAGYSPTVLCITHRLSALREMERVILLDRGRVADSGSAADLAGRSRLFRSLFHPDNPDTAK